MDSSSAATTASGGYVINFNVHGNMHINKHAAMSFFGNATSGSELLNDGIWVESHLRRVIALCREQREWLLDVARAEHAVGILQALQRELVARTSLSLVTSALVEETHNELKHTLADVVGNRVATSVRARYQEAPMLTVSSGDMQQVMFDLRVAFPPSQQHNAPVRLADVPNRGNRVTIMVDDAAALIRVGCSVWGGGPTESGVAAVLHVDLGRATRNTTQFLVRDCLSGVIPPLGVDETDPFLLWASELGSQVLWVVEGWTTTNRSGPLQAFLTSFPRAIFVVPMISAAVPNCDLVLRSAGTIQDEHGSEAKELLWREYSYLNNVPAPLVGSEEEEEEEMRRLALQPEEEEVVKRFCVEANVGVATLKTWFPGATLEVSVRAFLALAQMRWFMGHPASLAMRRFVFNGKAAANDEFAYLAADSMAFGIRFAKTAPGFRLFTRNHLCIVERHPISFDVSSASYVLHGRTFGSLAEVAQSQIDAGFKVQEDCCWWLAGDPVDQRAIAEQNWWCIDLLKRCEVCFIWNWNASAVRRRPRDFLQDELLQCAYFFGKESDLNLATLCRTMGNPRVWFLRVSTSQPGMLTLSVCNPGSRNPHNPKFPHYFKLAPLQIADDGSSLLFDRAHTVFFGASPTEPITSLAALAQWMNEQGYAPLNESRWGHRGYRGGADGVGNGAPTREEIARHAIAQAFVSLSQEERDGLFKKVFPACSQ